MHPQKIKAKLVELGVTQKSIADELGISLAAVSMTISGKCRSPRIRAAVAARIGIDVNRVFKRAA